MDNYCMYIIITKQPFFVDRDKLGGGERDVHEISNST